MLKLNNAAKELEDIKKELEVLTNESMLSLSNRLCQIRSVAHMADLFVENLADVPREEDICDGINAIISVLETAEKDSQIIHNKIFELYQRISYIV